MSQLTDRAKAFRAVISGFIDARREAKLKADEDNADAAAKYEYSAWLADAASRARHLQVATHPVKFQHSAIKGASSAWFGPSKWKPRPEIGTHSVETDFDEDWAISDAKHLDVYSFLNVAFEGKRLLDWACTGDDDLASALSDNRATAMAQLSLFASVRRADAHLTSSALAKQIYWLIGESPSLDVHYHLLQPMFSSTLESRVHREIRFSRSMAFEARGTKKAPPTYGEHYTYPRLVARKFGGSNEQNVSPLNKARGGVNYLLPSLPPDAWIERAAKVHKQESALQSFLWFEDVNKRVRDLAEFLRSVQNQNSTAAIRDERDRQVQAIADQFALFGASVRAGYPAGWTRDQGARLPWCEQLWLDPERVDLPDRETADDPQGRADDQAFREDYHRGDWCDEVATRFAQWLNQRLRERELPLLAEAEVRHWAGALVLDVTWPVPLRRRAVRGDA